MIQKKYTHILDISISLIFICLISIPFIGTFMPSSQSAAEKRTLAPKPHFKLEQIALMQFPKAFELFINDHFGFRDFFIKINNKIFLNIFFLSPSKKVTFGKDGWLIYVDENSLQDMHRTSYLTDDEKKIWKDYLTERHDWLKSQGITYRFVIAPDKHSIYPEVLPSNLKIPAKPSRCDDLLNTIGLFTKEVLVDLRAPLIEHKKNNTEHLLYYKTDTHWTPYGAYIGYLDIMKSIDKFVMKNNISISQGQLFNFGMGDMANMSGEEAKEPIQILNGLNLPDWHLAQVTIPIIPLAGSAIPFTANSTSVMGVFATHCDHGKGTALVIRDSFTNALLPYISSHFARVIYIWGFPTDELFIHLVQQEKPDVVIEERVERNMRIMPVLELKEKLDILSTALGRGYTPNQLKIRNISYEFIRKKAQLKIISQQQRSIILEGKEWRIGSELGGYVGTLIKNAESYQIDGWAGIPSIGQAADFVLVTKGDDVIFVHDILYDKEDVVIHFSNEKMRRSGFAMNIPQGIMNSYPGTLRIFAVCGKNIAEVSINPDLLKNSGISLT